MSRIHITGASGTGTTTLGHALAGRLRIPHFDSDDYYWIPTVPPYQIKRDPSIRDARLTEDLAGHSAWVWSGSVSSWAIDPPMTSCVFLTVPRDLRVARLRARERGRQFPYVSRAELESELEEFLEWAASYEAQATWAVGLCNATKRGWRACRFRCCASTATRRRNNGWSWCWLPSVTDWPRTQATSPTATWAWYSPIRER